MTPKEQAEEIMNEGMTFARKMLREHGEFHPFGVIRKSDSSIVHVGASDGRDFPPARDLIALLTENFRNNAQAREYEATAIFFDVRIAPPGSSEKGDAVQACLEHASGYCVNVFFPYHRSPDGAVTFGEVFAGRRDATVFDCN